MLFVKELLYDNAWSLCDWLLLERGKGSQPDKAALLLSWEGGLGSTHRPRKGYCTVQVSMPIPDIGDGN